MTTNAIASLWQRYLEGDPLEAKEREELAAALNEDPSLPERLAADRELDGMLGGLLQGESNADAFRQGVCSRIENIRDEDPAFVGAVSARLKGDSRVRARKTVGGSRVRWGVWVSVAACLAIIVGALVYNQRQEERVEETFIAHIEAAVPGVEIVRGNGTLSAVVDMGILAGDVIRTAGGQYLTIAYEGENTSVKVGGDTAVEIGGVRNGKRLGLHLGTIEATAAPQAAGKPMTVTTPHASCEVKGTRFVLAVGTAMTRLDVVEGQVLFTRLDDLSSVLVAAGQHAVAGSGIELAKTSVSAPASGTGYEDGSVILKDDFENGLANWMITGDYRYPDGRAEQREIIKAEKDYVITTEIERDGKKTRVAHCTGGVFTEYVIHFGLRPRVMSGPIEYPVMWEFDLKVIPGRSGSVVDKDRADWPESQLNVWRRWRHEYLPVENSTPEKFWRVRSYCDGKFESEKYADKTSVLGAAAGPGTIMMMDNVVIKKLVPKSGEKMKK